MGAPAPRLTPAGRVAALLILAASYAPWWAQRRLRDSKASIRVVVAGRQSGKTHAAAEEVLRAMLRRAGSQSCLLMPTYKSTKGPLRHMRRALAQLGPHGERWRWFEVDKVFRLWNGSELWVRTADDKEGVPTRGLTIDGILWVDEAAYVPREAFEAARLTQSAVADPLVLITTTPCGKNWVFEEFEAGVPGPSKRPLNESFRFRTTDSPYHNPAFVEDLREKLGARKALQELDAEFLGDANAAFDPKDLAKLFVPTVPERGERVTLGVDLGKEQDYVAVARMNEFGEARMLMRKRDVKWPDMEKELLDLAKRHDALVVVDLGRGGGYGGVMFDYLERELGAGRVLAVKTGIQGVRGQVAELLISDVQNGRLQVQADQLGQVLRHEMTFFEAHRSIVGGVERWSYHGPAGVGRDDEDEENEDHDDTVWALGLANWGRVHGWTSSDPCRGDFSGFGSLNNSLAKGGGARPAVPDRKQLGGFGGIARG